MNFSLIDDINKKVHFIGIGGISMSGLAEILLSYGFKVSGSDMKLSPMTQKLKNSGAVIYEGHNKRNVEQADIVVYTAAVSNDNPEIVAAKELNMPLVSRAEFLGALMKSHKNNIAISGTHGKTTTTSMLSHIFVNASMDPTILVGGELDLINGNVRTGKSDYFITEACEYKGSFLKFFPYVGIILNIDADHLDYYKDIDDIQNAFEKFSNLIPSNGFLVGFNEDKRVKELMDKAKCTTLGYGFNNAELKAVSIKFNKKGCASFTVTRNDIKLFDISLNVPGKHNVLNALASIAVSLIFNINNEAIINGLQSFNGTHKRFEFKGKLNGITVIDDYAHHPTEIKATLSTAQNYPHNRIVCVFQPHTYSRTLALLNEFSSAFDNADELVLADIYPAREKDTGVVSSEMLGNLIRKRGKKCTNFHSFDEITNYLKTILNDGDLLLTVGAGDVAEVGERFLNSK
ncbi:UDP-N-acetylmuramate--L-alanine ligase [Clostridium oryzae]|uniref:UDP-N-acetylmuramate--L-alanine ligase n=1 Tax=Clostridium oryzae TaxID=1450648 RepID=A0A1V4IMJ9_9CLOT|nr:UDP-N-acetylmuramate--L-alanine ligase [Clostridium oryzae]OPJ61089.1 UDP-N-acetylmuramate--L-alanine ligase [Clostridium oryzae]